ncbi:surfeit locus protein [Cichlidogyrus casuarinus]|uniref:Surfeit locus protein n=1 Tax=Cichlidogyrus casuarinus TaxID=1844966 RepID=A0ABD2Q4D8_9PLAT
MEGLFFSKIKVGNEELNLTATSDRKFKRTKIQNRIKNEKLGIFSGRDAKKILTKAEKQEQEMKALVVEAPEMANELQERRKWKLACLKAQGIKVRDDIKLIRRSAKMQENKKKKSRKAWEKRISQQEKQKQERQTKRNEHIQARKDAKKKKRYRRLVKKGHIIPELKNSQ